MKEQDCIRALALDDAALAIMDDRLKRRLKAKGWVMSKRHSGRERQWMHNLRSRVVNMRTYRRMKLGSMTWEDASTNRTKT